MILDLIGNTPLLRLGPPGPVEIWAKAEWANPGGSVKDRPALRMILEAEKTGELTPEKIILDATSGNTGIAYALIGAAKGYRVELCVPGNASPERKKILQALGATIVLTSKLEMTDGAIREARRRRDEHPDRYYYPDQYNNPNNWRAHHDTTGPEIWRQTEGRITHFVAGLGTTGTFVGVGRYLRSVAPDVELISMQPDSPYHGMEGLKHLETAMVPGIYDPSLAHRNLVVTTEEAHRETRQLAREHGWFVGISSGANVAAARKVASGLERGVVVTVLCDGGMKYLSDPFWEGGGAS